AALTGQAVPARLVVPAGRELVAAVVTKALRTSRLPHLRVRVADVAALVGAAQRLALEERLRIAQARVVLADAIVGASLVVARLDALEQVVAVAVHVARGELVAAAALHAVHAALVLVPLIRAAGLVVAAAGAAVA